MITNTNIRVQYNPTSDTDTWSFNVRYFQATDIVVEVIDNLGSSLILTLNALTQGFTVAPINSPENGAIITTSEAYGAGWQVNIYRNTPKTQTEKFLNGGAFKPRIINSALDKGIAVSQEIDDKIARSITAPITDAIGLNYEIPNVGARSNRALGFDTDGNVTSLDLSTTGSIGVDTDKGLILNNNIISTVINTDKMSYDVDGALTVNPVDSDMIDDGAVTNSKLSSGIDGAKINQGSIPFTSLPVIPDHHVLGQVSGVDNTPYQIFISQRTDMYPNSHNELVSQSAIKAYVDSKLNNNYVETSRTDIYTIPNSWTNIFELNILPKGVGSSFDLNVNINVAGEIGACFMRILRNGSPIFYGLPTEFPSVGDVGTTECTQYVSFNTAIGMDKLSFSGIDAPLSVSSVNYTVQLGAQYPNNTFLNRTMDYFSQVPTWTDGSNVSSFTVKEIA